MFRKLALVFVLMSGLWTAFAVLALAQAPTPSPNEVNEVAKNLWCPLCNGVRLDNCELQACIQMKEVIAQKLADGENQEQIRAYFVQQYGDVVLGAPSTQGFNSLAWILPVLAGLVGLAWLVYFVRSVTRRRPAAVHEAPSSEEGQVDNSSQDDYLSRVDDELDQYQ
jgi:cytochrome c-type biogenesis protein CcmH